ncbi:hypothetical protein KsCSTR_37450 [Candidatus Kuenenia stuttgartiensis]|uniref:Uncharacterized protein n=1 Tax=Kuenenia stuttgartiensis TaxID=174633 RepID=Q1Q669_KUEST|nr:hypothetical protein KsCSTR_37450 [Candidatus Kuenenia stuttgartiensis]CAJ73076.1 unknown protein [Candidatus Kuenenia stuttgartiensis]
MAIVFAMQLYCLVRNRPAEARRLVAVVPKINSFPDTCDTGMFPFKPHIFLVVSDHDRVALIQRKGRISCIKLVYPLLTPCERLVISLMVSLRFLR